jgi:DNA modification methylase
MSVVDYDSFVASKMRRQLPHGFEPAPIRGSLFPWQKHIVQWAVRQGRAALFEDCGLGKTLQQLEWAHQVVDHTHKPVLILTPLAVAHQTQREATRFGYHRVEVCRDQGDVSCDTEIAITNYERLEHFDPKAFGGVVLDESSILKNFTGKMRHALTAAFSETPFRLCCTATPSPNDYAEFGQHADFLGICTPAQMLATFFINDTFNTGDWRLKRHAEDEFWKWVAGWAACVSKPSDIGFSDEGYALPPLRMQTITVDVDIVEQKAPDELFRVATLSATTMHKEMRITAPDRAAKVAGLVNASLEPWIVWCNTNAEADELRARISDAVEVRGDDTPTEKERMLSAFTEGHARVIITKPSIAGMGLNWQHCHNVAFVGLSYSFEEFYQALRRSYRFGQQYPVNAYIVQAATEGAILQAVQAKMEAHAKMQTAMKAAAAHLKKTNVQESIVMKTDITTATGADWTMHHGDCVRVARTLPDNSIALSVFSPPFADLFTYSSDVQDLGNCANVEEFTRHFEILIAEMARVMMPGREVAVHCVDLLSTKWKHGRIEFQDFSGEIIRAFWRHGFLFHSRICIWKSPVTEMQRTKAHGLLYKTLKADSCDSRIGCADYLLVFRKPGENPVPVTKDPKQYPVDWWQEVASPVWMTVDQSNVLNRDGAREAQDERHICPLQLDVIERAVVLWSNPGELVWSPFAGIGSEGVQALKLGRSFVGSELKESYFKQACANLSNAGAQLDLFAKGAA